MPAAAGADDVEKAEKRPTEASPLLGRSVKTMRQELEDWWRNGTTAGFRFAASYSYRVAIFTGIIVTVPLLIPHGRKRFDDMGIPVHLIVCNMLFTIGPNVGATLAAGIRAMVGSLLAGLMIHQLNGAYPGGFAPDGTPVPAAFALGWSLLYIFLLLVLNINECIRFFAIGEYLYHMMAFMNPAVTLKPWQGLLRVDIFAGSLLALLCSLLPKPITAMDSLRSAVKDIASTVFPLTHRGLEYYCGNSPSLEYYKLVADMQKVKAQLDNAKNTLEDSWFECLGLGRDACSRLMLGELVDEMRICSLHLQPLAPICGRETFDESHARLVGVLRQPLLDVCDRMQELAQNCVQASMDGEISEKEAVAMRERVKELQAALVELQRAVGKEAGHAITEKTTGEHAIAWAVRAMAQHVIQRTEALLMWESPISSWMSFCLDPLKAVFTVRRTELKWACRNFFTLSISILLGCFGYQHFSFFSPYTSGPAYIVAVLLSRFVMSNLSIAKSRIAMVVMAKVIGQAGWIAFGYCSLYSQLVTLLLNVVFVQSFMFFAYTGGENAGFATRMAAIGVMELLRPCSNVWVTNAAYGNDYHEVIDNCVGVAVLLAVDMAFGGKPASGRAEEATREALLRFQQAFTAFFKGQKSEEVVIRDVRTVNSMIDVAAAASMSAREEATLWRKPWRPDFHTELVVYLTQLCQELHNAVHVLGNDVRPLHQLPTFRQTCGALVEKVDNTVELATAALRHDYDAVAQLAKSLPYNPEDSGHGVEHLGRLVKELAVHAAEVVPVTTRALPKRLGSEPAWIMESHLKALEAEAAAEGAKDAEQGEHEQTHAMQSVAPRLSIAIETLLSVSDLLGKLQQRIIVLQYR